jgi:hypothetical protein
MAVTSPNLKPPWIIHDGLSARLSKSIKHRKLKITSARFFLPRSRVKSYYGTGERKAKQSRSKQTTLRDGVCSFFKVNSIQNYSTSMARAQVGEFAPSKDAILLLFSPMSSKISHAATHLDPVGQSAAPAREMRDAKSVPVTKKLITKCSRLISQKATVPVEEKEHPLTLMHTNQGAAWRHHVRHACFYVRLPRKWITLRSVVVFAGCNRRGKRFPAFSIQQKRRALCVNTTMLLRSSFQVGVCQKLGVQGSAADWKLIHYRGTRMENLASFMPRNEQFFIVY